MQKIDDILQSDLGKENGIDDEQRKTWTSKDAPSKCYQVSSSELDSEMEDGIEVEPKEAWTIEQPIRTMSYKQTLIYFQKAVY